MAVKKRGFEKWIKITKVSTNTCFIKKDGENVLSIEFFYYAQICMSVFVQFAYPSVFSNFYFVIIICFSFLEKI